MIYLRGEPKIYDQWMWLSGWGYNDIIEYFKKSENNTNSDYLRTGFHGDKGLLSVSEPKYNASIAYSFIDAGKQLGYEEVDLNGNYHTGFMKIQGTIRDGRRCSTAKAYLQSAKDRPNLHISIESHANRLLLDTKKNRAVAVEFVRDKQIYTINASKEIILSAGAINSPKILMLSGIGPKSELDKLKIPVYQNLPVGETLFDHIGYGGLMFSFDKLVALDLNLLKAKNAIQYIKGKGPLTSLNGIVATALLKTKYAVSGIPDIQIIISVVPKVDGSADRKDSGLNTDFYNQIISNNNNTIQIMPVLVQARSFGSLKLQSSNPEDSPIINPNYLKDPMDVARLVEGIKMVLKLTQTNAFTKLNVRQINYNYPNCVYDENNLDKYLECIVRYINVAMFHAACTCRMGSRFDRHAVVDADLKVYKMKGLRVCDASVFPHLPNVLSKAPVIMMGEKVSDLIKSDQHLHVNQ